MQKILSFLLVVTMLFPIFVMEAGASTATTVSVEDVSVEKGGSVTVPVRLSGNSGICGATISITYDTALTLLNVERGDALPTLTMTKTGGPSANPLKLVFDGMEADAKSGTLVNLEFEVPERVRTYAISVSYEEGDIVDGALQPVSVAMKKGSIKVGESPGGGEEPEKPDEDTKTGLVIRLDSINASPGESVAVALRLSGNTGLCGATVSIAYDEALSLTSVTKGDALPTLTMTKTGGVSANPVKLVFDGMEADATNGSMAVLTFTAPQADGTYRITLSYEEGDIVDGALQPLDITLEDGEIVVGGTGTRVEIGNKSVTIPTEEEPEGMIYTAFYEKSGELIALQLSSPDYAVIKVEAPTTAAYAKVAWWKTLLRPMSDIEKVQLK